MSEKYEKIRVGIVGMGGRGVMSFGHRFITDYKEEIELVSICDTDEKKLKIAKDLLGEKITVHTDYAEFLKNDDMDAVIVTTPDCAHGELTFKALNAGKHVLCEKPLAISVEDCKKILAAEKESGKILQVGLCLRYTVIMGELIKILRRGDIGEVIMASATETLPGASHFARWHRKKEYSGGILLQKGTHSLDLLNWIINEKPVAVAGFGGRDVYKADEKYRGKRCSTCSDRKTCSEATKKQVKCNNCFVDTFVEETQKATHYVTDSCIFDPEADILDNAVVIVNYENNKKASFNLSLFGAGSDRKFTIIGSKGKIEASMGKREILIYKLKSGDIIKYNIAETAGGHGGGDDRELNSLISAVKENKKPLADAKAGVESVLVGLAAEESIEKGKIVVLEDLT